MDSAFVFILAAGAALIAFVLLMGVLEARRARAFERALDAGAADASDDAPAYLHDGDTVRLDDAIYRMRDARDRTRSPYLRELADRKISEAHAELLARIARDQRAGHGGIRNRARRT